jgi:hypothetical protein
MQFDAFNACMLASDLADATRKSRIYDLDRIENIEGIDLEAEFACDGSSN